MIDRPYLKMFVTKIDEKLHRYDQIAERRISGSRQIPSPGNDSWCDDIRCLK